MIIVLRVASCIGLTLAIVMCCYYDFVSTLFDQRYIQCGGGDDGTMSANVLIVSCFALVLVLGVVSIVLNQRRLSLRSSVIS